MYIITVDETSTLTSQEVNEDIESVLANNQDADLVVKPGSLSVRVGGKLDRYLHTPVENYYTTIVGFFISVSTCILEQVFCHLEGMCSDCR